jgi:hypothetical protein
MKGVLQQWACTYRGSRSIGAMPALGCNYKVHLLVHFGLPSSNGPSMSCKVEQSLPASMVREGIKRKGIKAQTNAGPALGTAPNLGSALPGLYRSFTTNRLVFSVFSSSSSLLCRGFDSMGERSSPYWPTSPRYWVGSNYDETLRT